MRLTKKQKVIATSALACGTIATQSVLIYNQHNNILEQQNINNELTKTNNKQSEVIKDISNVSKQQELEISELEKKVEEQAQELLKKEKEKSDLRKQIENLKSVSPTQITSKNISGTPIKMTLTFYGGGAEENGGYAGMNAYSGKLTAGTVASNVYPRGTKFKLPNGQVLTVNDKGGSNFDSYSRLDVYVPKLPGENKHQYDKRISNYGKKTVTVYKM